MTTHHDADSRYAWTRLMVTLALMTLGSSAMYVVSVVLPAVQAEFGVARGPLGRGDLGERGLADAVRRFGFVDDRLENVVTLLKQRSDCGVAGLGRRGARQSGRTERDGSGREQRRGGETEGDEPDLAGTHGIAPV